MNHLKHCIIPMCTLFIYCNHVRVNTCPSSLKSVFHSIRKSSELSMVLIQESGFLRFTDINDYIIARFMYRGGLYDTFNLFYDYFDPVSVIHSHFTRQSFHPNIQNLPWKYKLDL